ncbi:uncharacterized protein [Cicer arietinum]|uniref:uncharacterized protein n=1 Tax=Cicer arietinum TaxID=3827 RepID=UPI003CC5F668
MSKAKYIVEGGSSNRPPFFDGSDYYFWKNKMQLFLKSQDTGMWRIITDGDFTPRVDQDDLNSALKKEADWTAEDKAKVLLNSKAQLFLSCALSREESERVDECTTAKEVWDTLQTHHEGTSHVKETRIDIGIRKFELFEMQEGETIDEMYSRFTTIVNEMRSLGKAYTVQERVRKIMRCLPIIWRPMVTAISQAKNLESLPLEELIGTLRAHEIVLQEDKPVKKGKAIALKVSQEKITVPVEEESEENEQGDADEIALLTRRIQRMMRRRDQIKKGFQNRNPKTEIDKSQVTCFGCNKLGHYKAECPSNKNPPKRFPFKKKSMMATWDDSEESETEEEEEEANICLMAKTEEDEVMNSEPCHLCQQMGNEFDNLLNDSNLLIQKCSSLKEQFYKEKEEKERNQTENNLLKKMIQELKETRVFESEECQEHSALQTENVQLKNENELLKTDLLNFIKATETFHNIMGSQIGIFDKAGLGFNQTQKTKLYENFFVPERKEEKCKTRCSYCRKLGHLEFACYFRKRDEKIEKKKLFKHENHPVKIVSKKQQNGECSPVCSPNGESSKLQVERFKKSVKPKFNSPKSYIAKPISESTTNNTAVSKTRMIYHLKTNSQGPKTKWVPKTGMISPAD